MESINKIPPYDLNKESQVESSILYELDPDREISTISRKESRECDSELSFKLEPIEEIPKKDLVKSREHSSKLSYKFEPIEKIPEIEKIPVEYDHVLDSFLIRNDPRVEVRIDGEDPNNLKAFLDRRIKARYLDGTISVSVVDNILILIK
jgi:hypothetical protein